MAPPPSIRKYLYRLDDIERLARQRFGSCSFLYLYSITAQYIAYFKWLTTRDNDRIEGYHLDALHFYFHEKLRELFLSRSDIEWLSFEVSGSDLFPSDHIVSPHSGWVHLR